MAKTYFKISGVSIKTPDQFKISRYSITNMNRTADGKMKGEIIAKKTKLFLTWTAIGEVELRALLDLVWDTPNLFFDISYTENGTEYTKPMYVGEISTDLHQVKGSTWVWKDVELHFIEQ